ncbi:glycosyltransferase [Lelliottia amnigena]|uniref:Glycosyltransferase n=1 Tax=Lelliottia amnigena TaxID=61646 RepID=A0ABU7UBK9_LELAM
MKKIKILVVLYKESLGSSATIDSLKKIFPAAYDKAEFELSIWDNSPAPQSEKEINIFKKNCSGLKWVNYHHDPMNSSLSHVYNQIISDANENDYFILLDQDSLFDKNFIKEFLDVAEKHSPELILPVIKFKKVIVSPSKINFIKGEYFNSAPQGMIELKRLSAINSGMIISANYVQKNHFKYDVKLKNYCTDDYFMRVFRKKGKSVYVLNYVFEHELTLSTLNDNSEQLKERYRSMKEGKYIVYSDTCINRLAIRIYFFLHRFYMAFKYKDRDYLGL